MAFPDGRTSADTPIRPRIRSVALPTEHGGWGFTLEPILLGLLVAPSASAWEISAAALGIFLARRPVKILSSDLVRRRWLPRSTLALVFSIIFGGLALAGVIGALITTQGPFLIPVALAVPFALVALRADAYSRSHALLAELAGAIAMSATVAVITVSSGWGLAESLGLWLVLAARDVAAIVLVRGQVRRSKGKTAETKKIYLIQAASILTIATVAALGVVPWLSVVAVGLVGVVAVVSLNRPPIPAKTIGWTQMALGLAVVLVTAAGVRL
ncbi:MAG: YwiC-like family protein [Actinomycetota bacterium]